MVKYLVPVDGSRNAMAAFYTALSMVKKDKDELYIVTVVSHYEGAPIMKLSSPTQLKQLQEDAVKEGKELVGTYGKLCKVHQFKYHLIVLIANHIGEAICQEISRKNIDITIMGRRGLSTVKRFLIGSNSRYVAENATCSMVITVKGEWGPAELHTASRSDVRKLEEAERERRIEEREQEQKNFEKARQIESELDRSIAALAEETERLARIQEEKDAKAQENKEREAAHIGAVIDEEEERKRRIAEDSIIDDRHHKVEIFKVEN